jgi:hypothetical protein
MAFVEPTEGWRVRIRGVFVFAGLFGAWIHKTVGAGVVFVASVLPSVIFVFGR